MSPEVIGAVGMVAGAALFVLGIAQLACEHSDAPWSVRVCVAAVSLLGVWTCVDSWNAFAGILRQTDNKAVAFSAVLALYWGYRRSFGLSTLYERDSP